MQPSETFKQSKNVRVLNLPLPKNRVIAIGDVHGCLDELNELLSKLAPTVDDTVIFLGDLVDRGDSSEGVVQLVKTMGKNGNTYCILGNHDVKQIRYHYHQLKLLENPAYKVPMRVPSTYLELSNSSLEFLNSCPHAIFIPNIGTEDLYPLCFVHAGLAPSLFNQEANAFIRNRYFIKNVKDNKLTPVKSVEIDGVWYVPEGSYPWHHYWDGRWTVLYGHAVYFEPEIINNTVSCDGGCCFGGVLRAWVKPIGYSSFFVEIPSKMK